jgi:hypothetical protein
MMLIIYAAIVLTRSVIVCIFSFWMGRCSRELPFIDDSLPWTMSRGQAAPCTAHCRLHTTATSSA